MNPMTRLNNYFNDRELRTPTNPKHNPLSWSHGMDGSDWMVISSRDPERLERFTTAFAGRWNHVPATGIYPFDSELASLSTECSKSGRVFIVDVGGSQGGTMKELREQCSQLCGKIVAQDLEPSISSIPTGFLPPSLNIQPQVHNFFDPQLVPDAGVYYLRRILHN